MSKITVHNYEAFLLDYLEGNLDSSLIDELKQFAFSHPELEIDLTETSLPYITELNVEAEFKESLKKKEEPLEDEELLSYLEGLMDPEDRKQFEKKLSVNSGLKKAFDTYQKTLLQIDPEELFTEKNTLLKTEDDLILSDVTIAYVEGQLSNEEKSAFEKHLEDDERLRKNLLLTSQTILPAEHEITYPDKAALKKKTRVFVLYQRKTLLRVAAAILLFAFLTVTFNYLKTGDQPKKVISQKNNSNKTRQFVPDNNTLVNKEGSPVIKKDASSSIELTKLSEASGNNKNVSVKPETKIEVETPETKKDSERKEELSPMFVKQEERDSEPRQLAQTKETEPEQINTKNNPTVDSNIAVTHKITQLATIEEGSEEEFYSKSVQNEEKGLWKRAVQLAQRANKLGVKSVDGLEDSQNKQYRISFNSFSVEKK